MNYKITHSTTYSYSESVPICHNEVHLTPRESARQNCSYHRIAIRPHPLATDRRLDYFGNQVTFFTIEEGHHRLSVTARSKVQVHPLDLPPAESSPAWETVRDRLPGDLSPAGLETYQFAFKSPRVPISADLERYAVPSFPAKRPLIEALLDLTDRIHSDFEYDPTATTVTTPIDEVLRKRKGVCQDFAHLQIACVRSLGLAARYVSGYLLTAPPPGKERLIGADASHAWLSVFCPEIGWVDFDPTNNSISGTEHITLAWGRDYSDVCPIKGVFVGGGRHDVSVSVDVAAVV